jgi:hypothetical protein
MREKFRRGVIARMTPLIASIIRQGVAEGVFTTDFPDHTARVFMALFMGTNEAALDLFYSYQAAEMTFDQVEQALTAFGDAFARILGARPGSLGFADRLAVLREWLDAATPTSQDASTPTSQGDPA